MQHGVWCAECIHLSRSVCPTQPWPRPTPERSTSVSSSSLPRTGWDPPIPMWHRRLVILTMLLFGQISARRNYNLREIMFDLIQSFCPVNHFGEMDDIDEDWYWCIVRLNNFDAISQRRIKLFVCVCWCNGSQFRYDGKQVKNCAN